MESSLFKNISIGKTIVTIGIGIISALINNFCGVNAGTSGIIGVAMMYATGIFLWAYEWIQTVNEKLSKIDDSKSTNSNSNNFYNSSTILNVQPENVHDLIATIKNIEDNNQNGNKSKGKTR